MEPTPGDSQPLTLQELLDLRKIQNGLDVRDYNLAKRLRAIEARMPHLLDLGDPMGTYGPQDVLPYFGAITTKAGDAAIAERLDDPAAEDPVGLDNDAQIRWWGSQAERVIAAWGAFPLALDRGLKVVADLEAQGTRVEVLEWLAQRNPRHPLYARKDLIPQPWSTR